MTGLPGPPRCPEARRSDRRAPPVHADRQTPATGDSLPYLGPVARVRRIQSCGGEERDQGQGSGPKRADAPHADAVGDGTRNPEKETYWPTVDFMNAFISLVARFSAAIVAAYVGGEMMSPGSGISSTTGSWSSTGNGTELRFPAALPQTPALPAGRPLQTLSAASLTLSSRNAPFGHTSGPGLKAP